jgi:hypothetical protein
MIRYGGKRLGRPSKLCFAFDGRFRPHIRVQKWRQQVFAARPCLDVIPEPLAWQRVIHRRVRLQLILFQLRD